MRFRTKLAFLTSLMAISPLIPLELAVAQGLPGNRDRPPVATPSLGKPNLKPDGKLKLGPASPKFGDEKLVKKKPGQPTGDLPAAPRATFQEKTLSAPNSKLNSKGANTSSAARTETGGSQQPSSEDTINKSDKSKNSRNTSEGPRNVSNTKSSASEACKSCRAGCSSRWRNSCGGSTSCRSRYDACMRGCLDRGCSG